MRTIIVNVTEDHIARGTAGSNLFCPIALALADRGILRPSVGGTAWRPSPDADINEEQRLPPTARVFVETFDSDGPSAVPPFRFRTQVDERYLRTSE